MARFGLLMYNKGVWNNQTILNENFWREATNTSQSINLSYGYLWWLNGKAVIIYLNLKLIFRQYNSFWCKRYVYGIRKNDQKYI